MAFLNILTSSQKKNLLATLFLLALIYPTYWLFSQNQEIRKKAAEAPEAIVPLEVKSLSLADNTQKTVLLSSENSGLDVNFERAVLDKDFALNKKLVMKIYPKNFAENEILRFSLDLETTSDVQPSPSLTPAFTISPTALPSITTPTAVPTLGATISGTLTPSSPNSKVQGISTERNRVFFATDALKKYYTISYSVTQLKGEYAVSSLHFVYFDPDVKNWEPIVTTYDSKKNIITAQLDHFSDFGVDGQKAQVFAPTLKNWETSLYSGAVTYSMPIDALPGKGGLGPELTADYFSSRANQLTSAGDVFEKQKGSWLGAGWDMTIPEIRFLSLVNNQGAPCKITDPFKDGPVYSLVLGGKTEILGWVKDQGTYSLFITKSGMAVKGYYGSYSGQATFGISACSNRNKIINKWIVKDSAGREYTFDGSDQIVNGVAVLNLATANREVSIQDTSSGPQTHQVFIPSKFMVTQVKDLSGNRMVFEYQVPDFAKESGDKDHPYTHYLNTYLSKIKYNFDSSGNPQAMVKFSVEPKNNKPAFKGGQYYFDNHWEFNIDPGRINKIEVFSGSEQPNNLYRTYSFIYFNTDADSKFDTLQKILVFGQGSVTNKNRFVPSEFSYIKMSAGYHNCQKGDAFPFAYSCQPNTERAPYINKITNGYGGRVNFEYTNYKNEEKGFNVNAVTKRIVSNKDTVGVPASFDIVTEYSYEPTDLSSNIIRPNAGGGFGRVTQKDTVTGISTTTFFFPLALKDGDGGVDPEKNPFYGMPLRKVTYKKNGTDVLIYSDAYFLYQAKTIKTPEIDLYQYRNTQNEQERNIWIKLIDNGFVFVQTVATEEFTPKNSNYVTVPENSNGKLYSIASSLSGFMHNESRNWYDDYGRIIKTAQYADSPNFANNAPSIDFDGNKDQTTTGPKHLGSSLLNSRNLVLGWHCDSSKGDNDTNWYSTQRWDCDHPEKVYGWNSWYFTYGLPMDIWDIDSLPFDSSHRCDPATEACKKRYFPEMRRAFGPIIAKPQSLVRAVYTSYNNSMLQDKNLLGLVAETFASDKDVETGIAAQDKWNWTQNSYNGRGLLVSTTKENTKKPGDRLSSSSWQDRITSFSDYDSFGNITSTSDPRGTKTLMIYDNPGQPYDKILPSYVQVVSNNVELSRKTVNYNSMWLPVKSEEKINSSGATVEAVIDYDCLGRLKAVYKPDPATGKVSSPRPEADVFYYYYDYGAVGCGEGGVGSLPNLRTRTKIATSTGVNFLYSDVISDGLGNQRQAIVRKTKIDGQDKAVVAETVYNNRGLKGKESLPVSIPPLTNPSPTYQTVSLSGCDGKYSSSKNVTCYEYDELGRTTGVIDPLGNKTQTQYMGVKTIVTDAVNLSKSSPTQAVTFVNGLGQAVRSFTTHLSNKWSSDYGMITFLEYDVLGNAVRSSQKKCQNGDCSDNGVSDTNYLVSQSSFDNLGRKYAFNDMDMGLWKFRMDANGNLVEQLDAKGQRITYEYDALNRLTKKNYPDGTNVANIYDKNTVDGVTYEMWGKRMKIEDKSGSVIYFYDKRGRLTGDRKIIKKEIAGTTADQTASNNYTYSDSDVVTSMMITPDLSQSFSINNNYNEIGQLTSVAAASKNEGFSNLLLDQKYNIFGSPTVSTLGALGKGKYSIRGYDNVGRLSNICVGGSLSCTDSNSYMNYIYKERDKVGNITKLEKHAINNSGAMKTSTFAYEYDSAYQLKKASGSDYTAAYAYGYEGNLITKDEGGVLGISYTYPSPNDKNYFPRHAPKVVGGFTYRYDANGNLLEDEERTYAWNYDNKPVRITVKKTGSIDEYAYDGEGNRVMKRTSTASNFGSTPTPTPTRISTHKVCSGRKCVVVSGAGSNACQNDLQCIVAGIPTSTPKPTLKPAAKPTTAETVIINSSTGVSCQEICKAKTGSFCLGTGLNTLGTDTYRFVYSTDHCASYSGTNCATVMSSHPSSNLCFGNKVDWTYCRCAGKTAPITTPVPTQKDMN